MSKAMDTVTAMLEAEGFTDISIHLTRGWWLREDCYRWEARMRRVGVPLPLKSTYGCWDRLNLCARRGIVVDLRDKEIHAKGGS